VATFCLIHGQWHDGSSWRLVVDGLRERGHEAIAPDMPFDDVHADYYERARPALEAVQTIADPIVVVGHSLASAEAVIVAASRQPALVVYVCPRFGGFAPPDGAPAVFREGFPFPPKDAEGRGVWDPETAVEVMYPRLPHETARELAAQLRPGASAVGEFPLTSHPDVPTALIYATEDEFFTTEWEEFVARKMLGVEPIAIPGGHFPMVENPEALTELFDQLARRAR
jgi:pimeloyl-ACP methyl ester carboxylesterase